MNEEDLLNIINNKLLTFTEQDFFLLGGKGLLLLNVSRENQYFETHFPSREYILWVLKLSSNKAFQKIQKKLDEKKEIFLFVKTNKIKNYIFIEKISIENILSNKVQLSNTEQGWNKIGYLIKLQEILTLNIWNILGWDSNKETIINGLRLPQELLEIVRDNKWKYFFKTKHLFPQHIYAYNSLTLYINSITAKAYDVSSSFEKNAVRKKFNLRDRNKVICIGSIKEEFIILDLSDDFGIYTLFKGLFNYAKNFELLEENLKEIF